MYGSVQQIAKSCNKELVVQTTIGHLIQSFLHKRIRFIQDNYIVVLCNLLPCYKTFAIFSMTFVMEVGCPWGRTRLVTHTTFDMDLAVSRSSRKHWGENCCASTSVNNMWEMRARQTSSLGAVQHRVHKWTQSGRSSERSKQSKQNCL